MHASLGFVLNVAGNELFPELCKCSFFNRILDPLHQVQVKVQIVNCDQTKP